MRISSTGEACEATFEENIVSTTVGDLLEQFRGYFATGVEASRLILDLKTVRVIDSQGLNLIIGLYRECQRHEISLEVANPSEETKRLFRMFKLDRIFGSSLV